MMVALIKVDSPPKLEGARAWQVQSRALGETGHGARGGRTGDSGSLGGRWAAMRCAGLSSRGLSTPAAQQQHQARLLRFPTAKDGLHTHTHALHWRISWQSRLPPGVLGDALHQGLPLRSHRETKGQSDCCSLVGISTSLHP